MKSASHTSIKTALKFTCCSSLSVLERVTERFLRSSLVDLGTGTLGSSMYLLYFLMWYPSFINMKVKDDL